MAISQITTNFTGEVDVFPRLVRMTCNDSLSTITAAGYLSYAGVQFYSTDFIHVSYVDGIGIFTPVFVNGSINTLKQLGSNLIGIDVTVTYAQLATGGIVNLFPGTANAKYAIREMYIGGFGTNFSGGDRTLEITDNTTVYSIIPAATLETETNSRWGVVALPFPASANIMTPTAVGASLVAKYTGGATDYTAGSITITVILQQVN